MCIFEGAPDWRSHVKSASLKKMDRPRRWQAGVPWTVALVLAAGCSGPAVPGYQIQDIPDGFLFDANSDKAVSVLSQREMLSQGAWWGDIEAFEPESDIFLTRYAGNATFEEAQAARDLQATRYGNPASIDYGPVVDVFIDGRPAFAWMETRLDENGAVRSMDYKAVIPYDTTTWVVEFSTSERSRLVRDSLIRVVHSFGEGETEVDWGLIRIIGIILVGLVLVVIFASRRKEPVTDYGLWEPGTEPEEGGKPGPRSQRPPPGQGPPPHPPTGGGA